MAQLSPDPSSSTTVKQGQPQAKGERCTATLTLKRASKHRPGGEWSDNDYDVFVLHTSALLSDPYQ